MLTQFGELLRQIHNKNGCVMYDTAQSLGVSPVMISDIMHGKTHIPSGFIDRLSSCYDISDEMLHKLHEAAKPATNNTIKQEKNMVNISGYPPTTINYCPECGSRDIDIDNHWQGDGLLRCSECGLQCYIVEGDGSHGEV